MLSTSFGTAGRFKCRDSIKNDLSDLIEMWITNSLSFLLVLWGARIDCLDDVEFTPAIGLQGTPCYDNFKRAQVRPST